MKTKKLLTIMIMQLVLLAFSAAAVFASPDSAQISEADAPEEVGVVQDGSDNILNLVPVSSDTNRRSRLSGNDLLIYDALAPQIASVADGESSQTVFTVPISVLVGEDNRLTAEDLGLSTLLDGDEMSDDASYALYDYISFDLDKCLSALGADMPYELYWYNKTKGCSAEFKDWTCDIYENRAEFSPKTAMVFSFTASDSYKGEDDLHVDTEKTKAASAVKAHAQAIIEKYADLADYEKLDAYRQEICDQVAYAEDSIDSAVYGDEWQLINVFDDDSSTNAVCEGYTKAFQYLCDNSTFQDPAVVCNTVTGSMDNVDHMWNIVHMGNGFNYIADITNCDSGMSGYPDKLFLAGYVGGDLTAGYTFTDGAGITTYLYDEETRNLYDESELTLSDKNYKESPAPVFSEPIYTWSEDHKTCTAERMREDGLVTEKETQTADYTVIKSATCSAEGKGRYAASFENEAFEDQSYEITLKKLAHSWDEGKVTKEPTYNAAGSKRYTCTVCGQTKTETIPKKTTKKVTPSVSLSVYNYTYDGNTKKPKVTVKVSGKALSTDHYTVTGNTGHQSIGTYTVTVKFKNGYSGSKDVSFSIRPKGTSIVKLTPTAKAVTVKWGQQAAKMPKSRITGYQIQYNTDSSFSEGNKTTYSSGYSRTSKKLTGLRKGTKYYIRVRTYIKLDGKTYYSLWSKSRSVKIGA